MKDWITGQNSDGFGESLEQIPIKVEEGELYVSFWNRYRYYLYTDQEFDRISPCGETQTKPEEHGAIDLKL